MVDDSPRGIAIRPSLLIVVVAVLGAAVFMPALSGGWIYDDHPLIAGNPYIHSFHWWPRWFTTDFWNVNEEILQFGRRVVYWRPAVTTTYAVDWQLGGGSPLMFHLTNLLAQAGVAALGFVVLRRWIGALWPAFVAALLFAIHPTKAESVAWIAGRTDELCMLAVLVATIGIGRRLRGERGGLALEIGGTIAAYLCKEQAIVLPMFVAVETWVAAGRPRIDLALTKNVIVRALPQAGLALVYLAIRSQVLPIRGDSGHLTPTDHVIAVFETLGRFFTLAFAPHDLSIQQGLIHARGGALLYSLPFVIIGAVGLAVLLALAVIARRRIPVVTVGIAFFLITVAPTSNLVFTGMPTLVSERFLYLPFLGIALVVGGIVATLQGSWLRIGYAVVGAAILATAVISAKRATEWADEEVFWAREVELHPESREARQYRITKAMIDKRYETALVELLALTRTQEVGTLDVTGVDIGFQVADVLSRLVPDHDTAALHAIDQFCRAVLEGKAETAMLAVRNVHLQISTRGKSFDEQRTKFAAQYWALRASLQIRLGDHATARAYVQTAKTLCEACKHVVTVEALALAAAGRTDDAIAVVDRAQARGGNVQLATVREHLAAALEARNRSLSATGPAQIQQHASELAALELWGAAYDVLAPYKAQIEQAPGFALGFAELAFRAGEPGIAREVLAKNVSPDQIGPLFEDWTAKMGWHQ